MKPDKQFNKSVTLNMAVVFRFRLDVNLCDIDGQLPVLTMTFTWAFEHVKEFIFLILILDHARYDIMPGKEQK